MSKVDAARFVLQCQNWFEIALPIATHKAPARVILKNGARFESHAINWPDVYSIFMQEIYTPYYFPIEQNDLMVDIGANIGVFTVYAASRTRNTVYAFEPFPDNFKALEQNVRANRFHNVMPYQTAVCDRTGTELFLDAGVSQHHRLKKVALGTTEKYVEVPSITLQDFMDTHHIEQIDFLKMDCEGSEGIILSSTPKDYLQRIRKIVMEFHDQISKLKHDQIQELLEDAGFTTNMEWGTEKFKLGFLYAWRG